MWEQTDVIFTRAGMCACVCACVPLGVCVCDAAEVHSGDVHSGYTTI